MRIFGENKIIRVFVLAMSIGIFTGIHGFAQSDPNQEINRYIQAIQQGSLTNRIVTAKKITNSGLNDKRLFDVLEKELIEGFQAASGNAEYKETLQRVMDSGNSKIIRYARQSYDMLK